MKTYISKPLRVEAVKLTNQNAFEVMAWANSLQTSLYAPIIVGYTTSDEIQGLFIPTKEGNMLCSIGDYLVKEPFPAPGRMFYPVKADIFERRYDEAE